MTDEIVIIGYGAVGRTVVAQLTAEGRRVHVLQRSAPTMLPDGARFTACDVFDEAALCSAVAPARQIVCAIGFPYLSKTWEACWPAAMSNILSACAVTGARVVFVDNLYMYGPQDRPLTEDLPLTLQSRKPRVRAEVTRLWQAAHEMGNVEVAAVRAPDFYGPGVGQSILGDYGIGAIAAGRPVRLLSSPDHPHDVAHVDDFARAVVTLADATSADYGQAWHVPCARTRTLRELLAIAAAALNRPLEIRVMPRLLVRAAMALSPTVSSLAEMQFTFDRPYFVDATRFRERFWCDVTPFEIGIADAARSFRPPSR